MKIVGRDDWDGLDRWEKEQYLDALEVVSEMRRGVSFAEAARRVGRSEEEIIEYVLGDALQPESEGWSVEPVDELWRPMRILTDQGVREVGAKGSEPASLISSHWNAVKKLINQGDASDLSGFPRRSP